MLPVAPATRSEGEEKLTRMRPTSARSSRASSVDQPNRRRPHSARRERFTPEEQAAFGRCGSGSFLAAAARRRLGSLDRSPATSENDSQSSVPCSPVGQSPVGQSPVESVSGTSVASTHSAAVASTHSADAAPKLTVESPVRKVLARILPIEDEAKGPKRQHHRPPLIRRNAASDFDNHNEASASVSICTDRRSLLERFRTKLLERFRSVHDAFAQFDGVLSRDRALLPKEFRLAGKKTWYFRK